MSAEDTKPETIDPKQETPADEKPAKSLFSSLYESGPSDEYDTPSPKLPEAIEVSSLQDIWKKNPEPESEKKDSEAKDDPEKKDETPADPKLDESKDPEAKKPKLVEIKSKREKSPAPAKVSVDDADFQPTPAASSADEAKPPAEEKEEESKLSEFNVDDEDVYQYESAVYAAEKLGKAKDEPKKLLEYFKKRDEFIAKRQEEDEDYDKYDDSDFLKWDRSNRPKLSRSLYSEVERHRISQDIEESTNKVSSESAAKLKLLESKPKADKMKSDFANVGIAKAVPDDIMQEFAKIGEANPGSSQNEIQQIIADSMPFEYDFINEELGAAQKFANDVVDVMTGAVVFDGREGSRHLELAKRIEEMGRRFMKSDAAVRDGKAFVTRSMFQRAKPEARSKYWTWSDAQVLDAIASDTKAKLSAGIKSIRDKASKYRAAATPASKKEDDPKPKQEDTESRKRTEKPGVRPSGMMGIEETKDPAPTKSSGARLFGL